MKISLNTNELYNRILELYFIIVFHRFVLNLYWQMGGDFKQIYII